MRIDRRHSLSPRARGVVLALTTIVVGACREEAGTSAPQAARRALAPASASPGTSSTGDSPATGAPGDLDTAGADEAEGPAGDGPTPVARAMVIEDQTVAAAAADELFATRCAPCHGLRGQGDGRLAPNLNPRPRSFADAAWQASVTDTFLEQIIRDGGPAVGRSPLMPASPDLVERPAVLAALRERVRALGRAP